MIVCCTDEKPTFAGSRPIGTLPVPMGTATSENALVCMTAVVWPPSAPTSVQTTLVLASAPEGKEQPPESVTVSPRAGSGKSTIWEAWVESSTSVTGKGRVS